MLDRLESIEKLSRANKWARLRYAPARYVYAMWYRHVVYPLKKMPRAVKCRTFFGQSMEILLPAGMDIYLLGVKTHPSELRLVRFMIKHLQPEQTFVDVGAHFGFFSLLAAELVGAHGKVISVEAAATTFAQLDRNVRAYPHIQAFHQACSDRQETLDFYEFPTYFSEYNTAHPEQFKEAHWLKDNQPIRTTIQANTLDQLVSNVGYEPNMVKIDVEGAEDKVISGMSNLLHNYKQLFIIMEFISDDNHNDAHQVAAQRMQAAGFFPHRIKPDGQLSVLSIAEIRSYLQQQNIDSDNLVFCAPRSIASKQ